MPKAMDIHTFIAKSREKHGERYDYGCTIYVNAGTPLEVDCHEHGRFTVIRPRDHYSNRGTGCPKCSRSSLSFEQFLKDAQAIHGDRYDYSRVDYHDVNTPVEIICKKHGVFLQRPGAHKNRGDGCPDCGNIDRWDTRGRTSFSEMVYKFDSIHHGRYEYPDQKYSGLNSKVEIICLRHGAFFQKASNHLYQKSGCPECSEELRGSHIKPLTTQQWIAKAKKVHGDRYDYSMAVYEDNSSLVTLGCKEHGEFPVVANYHSSKVMARGCPKCSPSYISTDEWLGRARAVHGDVYDYSSVDYQGNRTKVKISCPKHGVFMQLPSQHLLGKGCYKCGRDRIAEKSIGVMTLPRAMRGKYKSRSGYLYIITARTKTGTNCFKVGVGSGKRHNVVAREMELAGLKVLDTEVYQFDDFGEAVVLEQVIHHRLASERFKSEMRFAGYTEVFLRKPQINRFRRNPHYLEYIHDHSKRL